MGRLTIRPGATRLLGVPPLRAHFPWHGSTPRAAALVRLVANVVGAPLPAALSVAFDSAGFLCALDVADSHCVSKTKTATDLIRSPFRPNSAFAGELNGASVLDCLRCRGQFARNDTSCQDLFLGARLLNVNRLQFYPRNPARFNVNEHAPGLVFLFREQYLKCRRKTSHNGYFFSVPH